MDLYHTWFYIHIVNTRWFVWSIVGIVFGFNILSPLLIWFIFRGKKVVGQKSVASGWFGRKDKQRTAS